MMSYPRFSQTSFVTSVLTVITRAFHLVITMEYLYLQDTLLWRILIITVYPSASTRSSLLFICSHPIAVSFHVVFKLAALVTYLLCTFISNNFVLNFILLIILLAADFWATKNVSGLWILKSYQHWLQNIIVKHKVYPVRLWCRSVVAWFFIVFLSYKHILIC